MEFLLLFIGVGLLASVMADTSEPQEDDDPPEPDATDGDDLISVLSQRDIDAGAGDDTITGPDNTLPDLQRISAGSGDDIVEVNVSGTEVEGNAGNDLFDGQYSASQIFGGSGDDTMLDTTRLDRTGIFGGSGDDTLDVFDADASTLEGAEGDDALHVNLGFAISVAGEGGDDRIEFDTVGDATATGGSGDDLLDLGDVFNDKVFGYGGDGDDTVTATENASLFGGAGNDLIRAAGFGLDPGSGYSLDVDGGSGDDTIAFDSSQFLVPQKHFVASLFGGEGADVFDLSLDEDYRVTHFTAPERFDPEDGTPQLEAVALGDFDNSEDEVVIEATALEPGNSLASAWLQTRTTDGVETTELILRFNRDGLPYRDIVVDFGTQPVSESDIVFVGDSVPVVLPARTV